MSRRRRERVLQCSPPWVPEPRGTHPLGYTPKGSRSGQASRPEEQAGAEKPSPRLATFCLQPPVASNCRVQHLLALK